MGTQEVIHLVKVLCKKFESWREDSKLINFDRKLNLSDQRRLLQTSIKHRIEVQCCQFLLIAIWVGISNQKGQKYASKLKIE